jgi:hypothetical protein
MTATQEFVVSIFMGVVFLFSIYAGLSNLLKLMVNFFNKEDKNE